MKDWLRDHPRMKSVIYQIAGLTLNFKIHNPTPNYLNSVVQGFGFKNFNLDSTHASEEGYITDCWKALLPDLPKDHFFHDFYTIQVSSHSYKVQFERIGCYRHPAETEANSLIHYLMKNQKLILDFWNFYLSDDTHGVYEETGYLSNMFKDWLEI